MVKTTYLYQFISPLYSRATSLFVWGSVQEPRRDADPSAVLLHHVAFPRGERLLLLLLWDGSNGKSYLTYRPQTFPLVQLTVNWSVLASNSSARYHRESEICRQLDEIIHLYFTACAKIWITKLCNTRLKPHQLNQLLAFLESNMTYPIWLEISFLHWSEEAAYPALLTCRVMHRSCIMSFFHFIIIFIMAQS